MASAERKRDRAANGVIVLAVLATFARALPYPLQKSWDDGRFLIDNRDVHEVSWRSLVAIFTQVQFQAYHPLHLLSYWLDVPWFGANPLVLHTVSALLWSAAACAFYALLRALGIGSPAALLGTLACALHPVQVEAVSWATGRKDVLAWLFVSLSMLWHVRGRFGASHVAFVLAALSKTTTLPLPIVLFVLDVIARGVRPWPALRKQLPKLLVALPLAVLVVLTWQTSSMLRASAGGWLGAALGACATWTHQLGTALWPSTLSPMYSTQALLSFRASTLLGPTLVLAAALALWRSRHELALSALLGFALWMLPVSNVVPMYFPLQDRYVSLPLAALALLVAALLDRKPTALVLGLGTAMVACLALRTLQYQGEWQSELRLWGHAAQTEPRAEYAWLKLGELRRDAGDLEGAIVAQQHHVQVAPTRKLAWAALFEAVALRDERIHQIAPTHARTFAQRYYDKLDDATALRDLAGALLAAGYVRTLELPMSRSIMLQPFPDALLARAATTQLAAGRPTVARFYARQMREASTSPELQALLLRRDYFEVLPGP